MRLKLLLLGLPLLALAAATADPGLKWGAESSGVRLGIGFGPTSPEATLRLVFQNVSVPHVEIPLGGIAPHGALYNMTFRITSPRGEEFPLFNMNGPTDRRVKVEPLVARLSRGQKYEVLLPLNKFVYLDRGKERLLPEMLAAQYSVRASLDTSGNPRQVDSLALWAGSVTSGELKK
jgi:hypothetical protein